ncbi:MAG: tetratricopeptide repeat protein [Candidatus Micrarchaeota archaeon]
MPTTAVKEKPKESAPELNLAPKLKAYLEKVPSKAEEMKTAGAERIAIELEDKPKLALAYQQKYNELVSDIAFILKSELGNSPNEEKFITSIWGIISSNFEVPTPGTMIDRMDEMLEKGTFDCDTCAFLVFDVARQVSVNLAIIHVPGHYFVKTDNFFFETRTGDYHPLAELNGSYPFIFNITSDPSAVSAQSYFIHGDNYCESAPNKAVAFFTKSIALNPIDSFAYWVRGNIYLEKKDYRKAIADYSKCIELAPTVPHGYLGRADAYIKRGEYEKATADYRKALEIGENAHKTSPDDMHALLIKLQAANSLISVDYEKKQAKERAAAKNK